MSNTEVPTTGKHQYGTSEFAASDDEGGGTKGKIAKKRFASRKITTQIVSALILCHLC